jgi:hypothetical protein
MVMLGASIMNSAFDTEGFNNRVKSIYGFGNVTVVDECQGGDTVELLLARLPAILATYAGQEGIAFPLSIGGNNVTNTRPYSSATDEEIAGMSQGLKDIIDLIEDGGHTVVMANITYRAYPAGAMVPPESNGTLVYNDSLVHPIMRSKLPQLWDSSINRPKFDLYTFIQDNQQFLDPDGIHLIDDAAEEAYRHFWFSRLATVVKPAVSILTVASGTKVIFDFNEENTFTQDNTFIGAINTYTGSATTVNKTGDLYVSVLNRNGSNNSGRGNGIDESTSLLNNVLLLTSFYINDVGETMTVTFSGMEAGISGVLTITASRSVTSGRVGEYTVQGLMQVLDAGLSVAPQASFPFTTLADGTVTLTIQVQVGSTVAYLNGCDITFD